MLVAPLHQSSVSNADGATQQTQISPQQLRRAACGLMRWSLPAQGKGMKALSSIARPLGYHDPTKEPRVGRALVPLLKEQEGNESTTLSPLLGSWDVLSNP